MKLSGLLDLNKGSIVSITGAGGKTTLMYTLAEELKSCNKVLVTTTTKIYVPDKIKYDFIEIGSENLNRLKRNSINGIYVYGASVNDEKKLTGINPEELEELINYFDYILVEADGSKGKPIKGWNNYEPVICKGTAKTIGILSIESIGKAINEYNVHRIQEFLHITSSTENELITKENLASLIFHPEGLFKNSAGERILFINKAETMEQIHNAKELTDVVKSINKEKILLEKIITGSLKHRNYVKE